MKKIFALTKIQALNFVRSLAMKSGGKSQSKVIWIILALPFLFLPQLIAVFGGMYNQFSALGMPELTIGVAFLMVSVLVLIQSFAVVLTTLVANKDIETLLVLPVKARAILISKFFFVYAGAAALSLYLMLVPTIRYAGDFGWHHVISALWIALLAPAIPLALNLLIIMPLARFLQNKRNRTVLYFVMNLLFVGGMAGLMMLSSKFVGANPDQGSMNALFLDLISGSYPPTKLAVGAFLFRGLDLALFSAMSLGVFLLVLMLVSKLFRNLITDINDSPVKKTAMAMSIGEANRVRTMSKSAHIYRRMFKILTSTSFTVMTLLMTSLTPFLLAIVYTASGFLSADLLQSEFAVKYGALVVLGVTLSNAVLDSMAQCALSREGKYFWENRVFPISAREYVGYYAKFHLAIVVVPQILLGIITACLFKVSLLHSVLAIGAGLTIGVSYVLAGLMLDLAMPTFDWTMIQQVVKNGRNQFIAAMGKIVFSVLIGFVLVQVLWSLDLTVRLLIALGLGIVLSAVAFWRLYTTGVKDFERIEP